MSYVLKGILTSTVGADVLTVRHTKILELFPLMEIIYLSDPRIKFIRWFRSADKTKAQYCIVFDSQAEYEAWATSNEAIRNHVNQELDAYMGANQIEDVKTFITGDETTWFTDSSITLQDEIDYIVEYM